MTNLSNRPQKSTFFSVIIQAAYDVALQLLKNITKKKFSETTEIFVREVPDRKTAFSLEVETRQRRNLLWEVVLWVHVVHFSFFFMK